MGIRSRIELLAESMNQKNLNYEIETHVTCLTS